MSYESFCSRVAKVLNDPNVQYREVEGHYTALQTTTLLYISYGPGETFPWAVSYLRDPIQTIASTLPRALKRQVASRSRN